MNSIKAMCAVTVAGHAIRATLLVANMSYARQINIVSGPFRMNCHV